MCDIENHISQVQSHPEMFTQIEENMVDEIIKLREEVHNLRIKLRESNYDYEPCSGASYGRNKDA